KQHERAAPNRVPLFRVSLCTRGQAAASVLSAPNAGSHIAVSLSRHPMRRLIALALMIAPLGARAQLADTKILTLQAAKTMLAAAEAEATKNNWTMSIAVVDAAGGLIPLPPYDAGAFRHLAGGR